MENIFTANIKSVLQKHFGDKADEIFERSQLIQYINLKTRSANKGSKARSSFGALYSIYTLVEDYIPNKVGYTTDYEGARQSNLINRQRQLAFGEKLQNHYYQNRTNSEFRKFFPTSEFDRIIIHNQTDSRYWINENLLKIKVGKTTYNLAEAIIETIDEYVKTKQDAFQRFIEACKDLQEIENSDADEIEKFIMDLLAPNVDARLFEIVSYSILKYYYQDTKIIWRFETDENFISENLQLYKTGRTNANDGGIDFVMKPLGKFFQVTETLDFKKYFLDIDKIQKYPITFVIKSSESTDEILEIIKENATKTYAIAAIVEKYMNCIEEVINIPTLQERFRATIEAGYLKSILDEIVTQSKVEFNYTDTDELEETT
jgi:hypothetical protein